MIHAKRPTHPLVWVGANHTPNHTHSHTRDLIINTLMFSTSCKQENRNCRVKQTAGNLSRQTWVRLTEEGNVPPQCLLFTLREIITDKHQLGPGRIDPHPQVSYKPLLSVVCKKPDEIATHKINKNATTCVTFFLLFTLGSMQFPYNPLTMRILSSTPPTSIASPSIQSQQQQPLTAGAPMVQQRVWEREPLLSEQYETLSDSDDWALLATALCWGWSVHPPHLPPPKTSLTH